jgi:hypothetical protein
VTNGVTYYFIFDRRKQFTEYEAAFRDRKEAYDYAEAKLGEFAHVTTNLRETLVTNAHIKTAAALNPCQPSRYRRRR